MPLTLPKHFEIVNGRGYYRPSGEMSLDESVELISNAIEFARKQGLPQLLVNAIGVTGFPSPTLSQRFNFVQKWVAAAGGAVRLAMVARPELIDPQKFGVTVAANRGLVGDVFTSESDAIAWLDESIPEAP